MITPERAMKRALVLARRGMGTTRPNPPVGAVLVKDGRVVGEGRHEKAGEAHAEVAALAAAGGDARGATLYVTLEPCDHHGRTGPCTQAVLEAGVAAVVIARRDPSEVSGAGADTLREAGVDVSFGLGAREAGYLLAGFQSRVERGRPRILLKMATSLDGRIATGKGDSRWISSPPSRAWVHRRRREADAVLVGAGTVVKDNPALTTREVAGRSADRIVVDSTLRVRPDARVWNDDGVRRIAVTIETSPASARQELLDRGVGVWILPPDKAGRPSLRSLASKLGDEGYNNIFCEGGGTLAGALFQDHLVDQAWLFQSRSILLGGEGPGWTQGLSVPAVARATRVTRTAMRPLGGDWLVTLVPESAQWWDPETAAAEAAAPFRFAGV